jgi:peptidyl-prolyl cis-trans isomerase A (cyclophilin A)
MMRVLLIAAFAFLTVGQVQEPRTAALPHVLIETPLGTIEVEIDTVRAPETAANFLKYVDGKFYDGGRFHRTVKPDNQPQSEFKIEVVQAGTDPARSKELFAPIALERTNTTKLSHVDGAVSMARSRPDTGRNEFFICIGDQPELDFAGKRNADGQGFAAFGRVIRGMEVVRKIQASPANAQALTPPVPILSISRQAAPAARMVDGRW